MALEFRPTIKSINIASEDLTKLTLEVKNSSLDGKYDDLRRFSGKTVNITIVPEYYRYVIPYDKSTNAATQKYNVNPDGTVELQKEEQTQLEVDQQGNIDIEDREFMVEKETVDQFIMAAHSLEFPGNINPRDVLSRIEQGEILADIADSYELAEVSVLSELERAREHYAPYAAAWDEKRKREGFEFNHNAPVEKPAEDTEVNEQEELAKTDDAVGNEEPEEPEEQETETSDDPY